MKRGAKPARCEQKIVSFEMSSRRFAPCMLLYAISQPPLLVASLFAIAGCALWSGSRGRDRRSGGRRGWKW